MLRANGTEVDLCDNAAQQQEIALSVFLGTELGPQQFAGGIIDCSEQGHPWPAALGPVVARTVDLDQHAFL